jgi:hypothetical protein
MSEGRIRVYGRRLSNREIADLLPLSAERQRERDMLVEEQNLLKQCLSAMPVGYIPTHTAENLPEMICDLAKALAEETTERENLERELATVTEQRDRLAEAIRKHRDELELTSGDSVDRILWNALAAVKEKQTKDSQSCPECDALASHGCNDGPCETHKL